MKYEYLFLSYLVLTSCSGLGSEVADPNIEPNSPLELVKRSSLNGMPGEILRCIHSYLGYRDQHNLRVSSGVALNALSLKKQVENIFNISGLENVADSEPELASVMRLAWISHDPFLFFVALMEDVVGGKKPYEVLFRPLILHIIRTYRQLGRAEKEKYDTFIYIRMARFAETCIANICAIKGHFDLVFEIAKDDTMVLREFVSNFENRKELRELFRANPQYVNQCLNGCLLADIDLLIVGQWIAECIINDLPQSYYEKLFRGDIRVLKFTVYSSLFSVDVPESEYARIHNQIIRVFDIYSSEIANPALFAALRMMNDIRFGLFDFDDFQAVSLNFIGKEHQLLQIARVAVLANKIDLFLDIYAKLKSINGELCMDKIVDFKNLNLNSLQAKSFKIIFEMIQADSDSDINDINDIIDINDIFESDYNLLLFVTKFYAVKHMKLDSSRDLVTFKFVVAENLLQFGFPPIWKLLSNWIMLTILLIQF